MTAAHVHFAIGVDAGGTKTEAVLGAVDDLRLDSPLGTGRSGPGNLRAVGFDIATQQILQAISAAFDDADVPPHRVRVLCLCVAGAGRASEREQLREWAETRNLATSIIITTDAEPLLAVASPSGVGIALISGTGSLAWGRNSSGVTARTGGWGYLFGDEGSGYAVALAGLRAVAQAADGRSPATALTDRMLTCLNVNEPSELIPRIYGGNFSRQQIAALAPVVFDAAADDPTARQIIAHAAHQLAQMVATLASRLEFTDGNYPLAVTGGVLVHQSEFREAILNQLNRSPGSASIVSQPALGALAIARSHVY